MLTREKLLKKPESRFVDDFNKQERLAREKLLKKPENGFIDCFNKQERLAREKLLKRPMIYPDFDDLHEKKDKGVVNGLEFKSKRKNTQRKCVDDREDDNEWAWDDEFNEKNISKKKRAMNNITKKEIPPKCPEPPPDMPEKMKDLITRKMNGTHLVRVIQKRLYQTDTGNIQNRLSIPFNQIIHNEEFFLTPKEVEILKGRGEIQTTMVEPSLAISQEKMVLKQWDMNKPTGKTSSMYALRTGWNYLRERNGLKKFDIVQLWSFRVNGELYFALFKVSERNDNSDFDGGDWRLRGRKTHDE
ncbi:DUF313 domain-containing protein [Cephalotus follicularis]|uniref:DUF313 domain-containing protein n=1 Tax=Cephalotus follicularis TaxID=3775 RepID=A0A1Q3BSG5_CEPFO|nr:DUF313 domain-containing protein [Cephalotus follicularis]